VFSADGADRRIQFRNFTIDCDSANHDQFFIKLIDYSDVLFDGIDGNLGRTNIISFADTTTIYNCDLDALRTCVDFIGIEDGGAPVYIVDGSSFRMTTDGGAAQSLLARFDGAGGTVIVKNSEFTSAHAGTRNFLECNAITGDVVGIPVTIEDNSFYNDVTLKLGGTIGGSSGVTYELTYEDNTWPTSECPPAFQIIDSVTVVADEMHWFWGGDYLSYSYIWSDIGEVEGVGHLKKYCDGTHYVSAAFDLVADTLDNFHNFTIPVVKYGFTSGTLNSTASVCWNPGVDKWYAEMDADWCTTKACTLYWEATVTECDSSGTSAEQSYIYRNDMGPCKDPLVCD